MRRNISVLFVLMLLLTADALCIGHTLGAGGSIYLSDTVRWLGLEAVTAIALVLLSIRVLLPVFVSLKRRSFKKAGFSPRQPLYRLFVSVWF